MDIDEVLKRIRSGKVDELLIEGLTLPNGSKISRVEINTDEDTRLFTKAVEDIGRVLPEEPHTAPQKPTQGLMLEEAIKEHLKDLERKGVADKTLIESRHSLKLLLGITGNKPVKQITVSDLREYLDEVKHYPRNASQKKAYKFLTVRQAIAKAKNSNEREVATHTLLKHHSRLSVFFNSLVKMDELKRNPISALPLPKSKNGQRETRRAFTPEEVKTIFGSEFLPWAKKYPHRFWGVILGLYSGARINEISQLFKDDFQQVGGRWGFHINERHKTQRVKNTSSKRFVPVALPVIEAGFLQWLETVQTPRLFPHLPGNEKRAYGIQLSRQFSTYVKSIGITEHGLTFHAFRHFFSSLLYDEGLTLEEIALITGHSDSKAKTVLATYYIESLKSGKGFAVNEKNFLRACEVIDRFKPNVIIPTLKEWKNFHR